VGVNRSSKKAGRFRKFWHNLKGWKKTLILIVIIYLLIGTIFYIGNSISEKKLDYKELVIIPSWGFMFLSYWAFIIYCGITQSCTNMGI